MTTRIRNLKPGQHFILKRTGDKYEFLGHKRDTPSGTLYVARRKGFAAPTTLHHSCHVILDGEPMANQWRTNGEPLKNFWFATGAIMNNPKITMQTIQEDDSTYTVEVRFINLQSERQAEITMDYVQERICGEQIVENKS